MGLTGIAGAIALNLALATSSFATATALTPPAVARPALTPPAVASAALTRSGRSTRDLDLVLPLRADLDGLRRFALAVSNPSSAEYGAYRSIPQLSARFGASEQTREQVTRYLNRVGARDVHVDVTGLFARATVTLSLAQRVFRAHLRQLRTAHGASFVAPVGNAGTVPVPIPLRGAVTGVVGLDTQPLRLAVGMSRRAGGQLLSAHAASQPSSARMRSGSPSGCTAGVGSGGFTPNQYLTAYNYAPLRQAGLAGQGERVALIEVDGFKYSDIQQFASCFGLPIPALNGFGVGVAKPGLAPGGESTLDLEILDAAAPRLKSIDVYETRPQAADTLQALTAPLRSRQRPQVISASLGLCEPVLYGAVGAAGIGTAEGALQMAAASGITFLAASGDQGSADCTRPDGVPYRLLSVNYPASSWWATGVGGTNLVLSGANGITSQLVWNDAGLQPGSAGGGGASHLFGRPGYQNGVVRRRYRAVPDVSMLADIAPGYAIFCSAQGDCINRASPDPWQAVGGTSAATPLLAGGFALIDQALSAQHQRPLGLVNPLLYRGAASASGASLFSDVTAIGNDVGSDLPPSRRPLGCCAARRGYDEASGLGSVNLAALAVTALGAEPPDVRLTLSLPPRQRPLRTGHVLATVACSGACLAGAYVKVPLGRGRTLELDSRITRLRAAGARTLTLRFSKAQLRHLRGLHHRTIAAVRAVLFDPVVLGVLNRAGDAIEKGTAARRLSLTR
jgi:subtilase family serine protease